MYLIHFQSKIKQSQKWMKTQAQSKPIACSRLFLYLLTQLEKKIGKNKLEEKNEYNPADALLKQTIT